MGRFAASFLLMVACLASVATPAFGIDLSFLWGREPVEASRPDGRLDAGSVRCAECHPQAIDAVGLSFAGSRLAGHPVGLLYADAWRRNPRSMRAPSALHPAIDLPAGRISCLSCHALRSAVSPAALAGSPACPLVSGLSRPQRELCVACHLH